MSTAAYILIAALFIAAGAWNVVRQINRASEDDDHGFKDMES